jgi:hypothetical protein
MIPAMNDVDLSRAESAVSNDRGNEWGQLNSIRVVD